MSIKYTVVPYALRKGAFYARPIQINTRDLKTLIRNISEETTISQSEIGVVVEAFVKEIVQGILDGDRVSIDGFADFRPRLSQTLASGSDSFDPESGGVLRIRAALKSQLTRRIRKQAQYEKIVIGEKNPLLKSFWDVASKRSESYTPGAIGQINGKNLKIWDPESEDEGVYFIDVKSGSPIKAQIFQKNVSRELVFQIPVDLTGARQVEVRTRYTEGGELRFGCLGIVISQISQGHLPRAG